MMTFVLAAAMLVGALYIGAAIEGVMTPPRVDASPILDARLPTTYHTSGPKD